MSHQITSEDNWLVQCLFLAAFGALLFYGTSTGWIADQLGVQSVAASQPARTEAIADDVNAEYEDKAFSKTVSENSGVPRILLSGVTSNQEVGGTLYVTVLPKEFESVATISLQLNNESLLPKESGSATYAIDTTQYEDGRYNLVVDVEGVFDADEVALQDTVQFVINNTDRKKVETYETKKDEPAEIKTNVSLQRVTLNEGVHVRSTPRGESIGGQPAGAAGVVRQDSAKKDGDYTWIYVTFDSGVSGYVAQEYTTWNPSQIKKEASSQVASPSPVALEQILAQMQELQALVLQLQARLAELEAAE